MRNREERRDGRRKRSCGKTEVALAVRGLLFQMLHHPCRGAHRIPVDTMIVGHQNESVDRLGGLADLPQQNRLRRLVRTYNKSRATTPPQSHFPVLFVGLRY